MNPVLHRKVKSVPVMRACMKSRGVASLVLDLMNSDLNGGEWSASYPGHVTAMVAVQ